MHGVLGTAAVMRVRRQGRERRDALRNDSLDGRGLAQRPRRRLTHFAQLPDSGYEALARRTGLGTRLGRDLLLTGASASC